MKEMILMQELISNFRRGEIDLSYFSIRFYELFSIIEDSGRGWPEQLKSRWFDLDEISHRENLDSSYNSEFIKSTIDEMWDILESQI